MTTEDKAPLTFIESSGNVFKDLELEHPILEALISNLRIAIRTDPRTVNGLVEGIINFHARELSKARKEAVNDFAAYLKNTTMGTVQREKLPSFAQQFLESRSTSQPNEDKKDG